MWALIILKLTGSLTPGRNTNRDRGKKKQGMELVAGKVLLECSFLIPVNRDKNLSDGKAHRRIAWKWLDDQLMKFEGATRALDLYEGWYPDPDTGKRGTDRSRKYWLALPAEKIEQLRSLLADACRVFRQKCIYLSIAGRVEFVKGAR